MDSWHYIADARLAELHEHVARLVKRAGKLGVPAPVIAVGDAIDAPIRSRNNRGDLVDTGRVSRTWPVIVSGDAPRIAGWSLAAVLQHVEGEVIVRTVPGTEIPAAYRDATGDCDHCRTRRQRNDTFVLAHDDGRFCVVGRQCLRDFLGHTSPHAIAEWCELILSLHGFADACEDGEGGCGRGASLWTLSGFLATTAATIRTSGWVSRSKARDDMTGRVRATADETLYHLTCQHREPCEHPTVTGADAALADAAIAWASALEPASDYEHNLAAVARLGTVNHRLAGIAASMLPAYQRTIERTAPTNGHASQHFGTVGKRSVYSLTVDSVRYLEGNYGTTTLVKMHDADGNVATWFASGSKEFEAGQSLTVKATVKAHSERNGIAETQLTRCAMTSPRAQKE
jgi:hypothetical protein